MDYDNWKSDVEQLLSKLNTIDFGYPLGDNVIHESHSNESLAIRDWNNTASLEEVRDFLDVCDGISWPDVQNGYYIRRRIDIGQAKDEYEPVRVCGSIDYDIVVVGSGGTGVLFAMNRDGQVLLVPPGRIEMNSYFDHSGSVRVIAERFSKFAELLVTDLRAFVENTPDHSYVS